MLIENVSRDEKEKFHLDETLIGYKDKSNHHVHFLKKTNSSPPIRITISFGFGLK